LAALTFPLSLFVCIKVVQEYERAVIFRLGRNVGGGGAKGPGLFFVLPCIDDLINVDLRTITIDVPPQEILTKDSVTVSVDAVIYYRIFSPVLSVNKVTDAKYSTKLLASTSLRTILGTKSLQDILTDKESIAHHLKELLDEATDQWGVKVERVELKDVSLPTSMQRSMATEAEATRDARAKVVSAEGEQRAAVALRQAADVMSSNPIALQLRYLQTLSGIAAEKNSTIIFPIPIELLKKLAQKA
jgi:erythrocyte band 7 integral membrane protein